MTPAPALNEPWEEADRQHEAMRFGIWLFFATEILFFGGLFLLYAFARTNDWTGFSAGAVKTNATLGTVNTAILLTSSFAIAIAERAIRAGLIAFGKAALYATIALGLAFLVVKGFEYRADLAEHLLPGRADFRFGTVGATQFWCFYWTITLVHATHLTIGLGAIVRLLLLDRRGELGPRWMGVEVTTLYWHLVDVVWILLWPLLYLVNR